MGGASSTANVRELVALKRSEADIVNLMMPIYYTTDQVTDQDLIVARKLWNMILDDTSPEFLRIKDIPELSNDCPTCVTFFVCISFSYLYQLN